MLIGIAGEVAVAKNATVVVKDVLNTANIVLFNVVSNLSSKVLSVDCLFCFHASVKTNDENEYSEITITWGIDDIDRNNYNIFKPNDYRGEVVFKNDFDAITVNSLKHIEKTCNFINDWECDLEGCSGYKGKIAIPNTTICFIQDYKELYGDNFNRNVFLQNLSDFRSNTIPKNNKLKNWKNYIGFVNGELKYITVSFRSTVKTLLPMKIKEPVYINVENMMIDINKNTPNSIGDAFQDAGITWVWYDIERNLISSMFNGLAICFHEPFIVIGFINPF